MRKFFVHLRRSSRIQCGHSLAKLPALWVSASPAITRSFGTYS
jgi:hypothetical protein